VNNDYVHCDNRNILKKVTI